MHLQIFKKYRVLFYIIGLFLLGLILVIIPFEKNKVILQPASHTNVPQVISASASSQLSPELKNGQTVKVARVIDGDTIELEDGQRVRYIGIDTPETVDPRKSVQCFGKEASSKNKELVEGKTVRLEKDISETDKYGRLLRYVYVDDIFVNDYLVAEGFAHASTFPPDIKYQEEFLKSERQAQASNKGLWLSCNGNDQVTQQPLTGCAIKGNISTSGEKIYHLPGQKYYDETVIDTSKGEKWFCSEEEATAAGWRKSKL